MINIAEENQKIEIGYQASMYTAASAATVLGAGAAANATYSMGTILGSASGVVTIALAVVQVASMLKERYDNNVEYSDGLYKVLDEMDSLYELYSTAQEREIVIETATNITKGKTLNPDEILRDLGALKNTGNFASNEEAMIFDATLRELLHNSGKSIDEVELMIPQIIEKMKNGEDLGDFFKDAGISFEGITRIDLDGNTNNMTPQELQKILSNEENKLKIDKKFETLVFSENDLALLRSAYDAVDKRIINADYNSPMNEFESIIWNRLKGTATRTENLEYKEVDGKPVISQVFEEDAIVDFKPGTAGYSDRIAKFLKVMNKNTELMDDVYIRELAEQEAAMYKYKQDYEYEYGYPQESVVTPVTGVENVANAGQTDVIAVGSTENTGVVSAVGLSDESLKLLEDINSNVIDIYGALGLSEENASKIQLTDKIIELIDQINNLNISYENYKNYQSTMMITMNSIKTSINSIALNSTVGQMSDEIPEDEMLYSLIESYDLYDSKNNKFGITFFPPDEMSVNNLVRTPEYEAAKAAELEALKVQKRKMFENEKEPLVEHELSYYLNNYPKFREDLTLWKDQIKGVLFPNKDVDALDLEISKQNIINVQLLYNIIDLLKEVKSDVKNN